MTPRTRIPDDATVLIDTNPIIYVLEGHGLAGKFEALFAAIDAGRIHALVTPITVAEVVTGPLQAGHEALAGRYLHALTRDPRWKVREIDSEIAVMAARLRA